MYYIVLFCSRNNAFRFYDVLKREDVDADLISTPRSTNLSCGLSVKVYDLSAAKRLLSYSTYPSYHGILMAEQENGRLIYTKID